MGSVDPPDKRWRRRCLRAWAVCTSIPVWGALSILLVAIATSVFSVGLNMIVQAFSELIDVGQVGQFVMLLTRSFAMLSLAVQVVAVSFIFCDKLRIRRLACCGNPSLGGVSAPGAGACNKLLACACYAGGYLVPVAIWALVCLGLIATVVVSLAAFLFITLAGLCKFGARGWDAFYSHYQSDQSEVLLSNIKQASNGTVAALDTAIVTLSNFTCVGDARLADEITGGALLLLIGVPLAVLAHVILLVSYTGAQAAVHARLLEMRRMARNQLHPDDPEGPTKAVTV